MWCRTVMALVRDDAGRPAHITAMLEDISDRRRLADAERRESLVTVAAGVAHGFNNLLQVILGGVGLIKEYLPPDPELEAIVRGIDSATIKAVAIAPVNASLLGRHGPTAKRVRSRRNDPQAVSAARDAGLERRSHDDRAGTSSHRRR